MTGSSVATGLVPSNVTSVAVAAASTNAPVQAASVTVKWRGTYTGPRLSLSATRRGRQVAPDHASTREPPGAGKAASRPVAKTLLSAGRNGSRRQRPAPCPAGQPPSPGPARPLPREAAKVRWHRELPLSPALPRDRTTSLREL